jgi:hypothetical protein
MSGRLLLSLLVARLFTPCHLAPTPVDAQAVGTKSIKTIIDMRRRSSLIWINLPRRRDARNEAARANVESGGGMSMAFDLFGRSAWFRRTPDDEETAKLDRIRS